MVRKNGCYSGSAVEHEGKLILFYTGNVKNKEGNRETYQRIAKLEDGLHFQKKKDLLFIFRKGTRHIFVTRKCEKRKIHGTLLLVPKRE